jgi:acylphosphatase
MMEVNGKSRAHILVSGKVQGVYFRQNTLIVATEHGVMGWVRNLPDGRVEAILEGEQENVSKVIKWCHRGPPEARVDDLNVKYEKYIGEFRDFTITD